MLFSPVPNTPDTPRSAGLTPTALKDGRFAFDPNNLPPPSPKRGEAWEKYAFWPPWSNSLSSVHYLGRLLILVGSAASEMAAMSPIGQSNNNTVDRLRNLVAGARERCVIAICAAWIKDAESCMMLEDWTRSPEKRDLTKMPAQFMDFESAVLSGMQKVLYISEAMAKSGSVDVVPPPPAKSLQMVRSQFVTSLYKALSGIVDNAEKPIMKSNDEWINDANGLASPSTRVAVTNMTASSVNASDRVSNLMN
jgi:exocyst complex component 2